MNAIKGRLRSFKAICGQSMKGSPSPRMSTFILWMIHFHPLDRLLSPFEPSTFILWTVHFPHKPLNNGNRPLYEGPPTFGGPWFNKVFRIVFFDHVKTEKNFVRLREFLKVMIFLNFWYQKLKIWLVRSAFFYKNNLFCWKSDLSLKLTIWGTKWTFYYRIQDFENLNKLKLR